MATISLTNEDTGEIVGQVGSVTTNAGASSPFPSDAVAPVPSMTLTVASRDSQDITYMTGDSATARLRDDDTVFQGHMNSVQVPEVGGLASVTVDHHTSSLNQEIRALPVFSTGHDGGNGAGIIEGAISQWAAECGLFRNGVRGNVLLGIHNIAPGIGYYRHPVMRYLGVEYGAGNDYLQWVPTEATVVDQGVSLGVGETIRLVIGMDAQGSAHRKSVVSGNITFSATVLSPTGDAEAVTTYNEPTISWAFNTATGNFTLKETTRTAGEADKFAINYTAAPTARKNPLFFEITITRTANSTLRYDCRTVFSEDFPAPETSSTGTVTNSYIPQQLSTTQMTLDSFVVPGTARLRDGVQSVYLTRGGVPNTNTYWEERGFLSAMTVFERADWAYTVVPGISGNAWQMLNDLASVYGMMFIPLLGGMVRPGDVAPLLSEFFGNKVDGASLSTQVREMAETVEVVNYDYTHSRDSFSPIQLLVSDTAYSVNLGERQEHTVQTDATFTTLEQPRCVTVPTAIKAHQDKRIGQSLYSVYDSDNLEVDPNTWNDGGGFISVESTTTPGELKLVVQAPNNPLASRKPPFIISIEGTDPSLIISGLGAKSDKKTITSYTGAGDGINVKKLGTTYDSPLVVRDSQAWEVAMLLGSVYGTIPSVLTGNREANGFGGLADIGVRYRNALYLATQWSLQGTRVQLSSTIRFTPNSIFNEEYSDMNCGQFNTLYAGKTIGYLNISPLRH